MAGAGYKLFNTGDVLTAQQVNEYLMQQTVMSFANAAARTTALSGVLAEGMVSYLQDTNVVEIYTGASWVSLDDPNAIQNSLLTTTGDTIYASGASTPARLAIGTTGQVLTVSAGGVPSWATATSGSITLISEQTLSGASSVTFGSISGTYKRLLLIWSGLYLTAGTTQWALRFNNDSTAAIYRFNSLSASGGTASAVTGNDTKCSNNAFAENNTNTNLEQTCIGNLLIDNYASTTRFKPYTYHNGYRRTATGDSFVERTEGTYASTSAITSLDIVRTSGTGNMTNLSSTSIRLYGIN